MKKTNGGCALRKVLAALAIALALALPAAAEESFGFGDTEEAPAAGPTGASEGLRIGGWVGFDASSFLLADDDISKTPFEGIGAGRIGFEAKGASVDAALRLKISKAILSGSPWDLLDEAFVRLYFDPIDLEGGLIKLSWGKADSQSVLDVVNPRDYSDLTVTDELEQKIARPMLHATLGLGDLSKLEAVFLPGFEGHRFAWDGRWTLTSVAAQKESARGMFYYGTNPTANGGKGDGLYANYYSTAWATAYSAAYSAAYTTYYNAVYSTAYSAAYTPTYNGLLAAYTAQYTSAGFTAGQAGVLAAIDADNAAKISAASTANTAATSQADTYVAGLATTATEANKAAIASQAAAAADERVAGLLDYPDTNTLDYAQGGARFTTSLGAVDLGLQYLYGFLPKPVASADPAKAAANGNRVPISYNRYHHAGADLATVLFGFNLRAEVAANITDDLAGDKPEVYNPALAWSFGFDRDLFAGISLNLQGTGSYRLFEEGIGTSAYDIETGTDQTRTRITGVLMQKLMKDTVEWKIVAIYGVEDRDFMIVPSVGFVAGDGRLDISGGFFGGESDGELGQYSDNAYARISLSCDF